MSDGLPQRVPSNRPAADRHYSLDENEALEAVKRTLRAWFGKALRTSAMRRSGRATYTIRFASL